MAPRTNDQPAFDLFKTYFTDISRYPLLTAQEERQLADRVFTSGDAQAAEKIVLSNLRLVVKLASIYHSDYLNVFDLIQEGNVGLVRASRKYNPHKGTRFSTYASYWIKAHILKHIMNAWGVTKIGTTDNQRKIFFGLAKAKRQLFAVGVEPTPEELARALDVAEEDIRVMEKRLSSSGITDDIRDHLETIRGMVDIEEIVAAKERSETIREMISAFKARLDARDKFILENRIMGDCPLTLSEIGKRFSITRERVRQLEMALRRRLKKNLRQSVWMRQVSQRRLAAKIGVAVPERSSVLSYDRPSDANARSTKNGFLAANLSAGTSSTGV